MDIYSTYYMLAAVEELDPEHTFFKSRYFPTDVEMDVFGTSKVLADYREGSRKKAPFVLPRVGSVPVGREGFETWELEPANICVSMPLTLDHLNKRGFGESLMSGLTPEQREKRLLMSDLSELSRRIARTEELQSCRTMLTNGCIMQHRTDKANVYENVGVSFYEGDNNPALFTPSEPWTHSTEVNGTLTAGNWYGDICAMVKMLTSHGRPAQEIVCDSALGEFLLQDVWILRMLDNRRAEMGRIQPGVLTDYVWELGTFRFNGHPLTILVCDGTYEDDNGEDKPYLDEGTVIVTAPACGKGLYGAVTQLEADGEFHTYSGTRVPQHIFTLRPPTKETQLTARPLLVPKRKNPWSVATGVLG